MLESPYGEVSKLVPARVRTSIGGCPICILDVDSEHFYINISCLAPFYSLI